MRKRSDNENPDHDFEDFIERLEGALNLSVVRSLLQTFDDAMDDGGTQDIVCALLDTINSDLYAEAFASEYSELQARAPEWLDVLISDRSRIDDRFVYRLPPNIRTEIGS